MLGGSTSPLLVDTLVTLRRTLNSLPEPAHHERHTSAVVTQFLSTYEPDEILTDLGGHGVAAVFRAAEPGPRVLVRCELDALPVEPTEGSTEGRPTIVEHRCGHDGHMAIVCGLAPLLHYSPPSRGEVVLLFQPAEETGEGARQVACDPEFPRIAPDFAIGFHNLPGYREGSIVLRPGIFASASVGLEVQLQGVESHAAEPELGVSPAPAMMELITHLSGLAAGLDHGQRVTVTHASLGRPSFGLSPARAEVWATLRAYATSDLGALRARAERAALDVADRHGLGASLSWREDFPECRNDARLVEVFEASCAALGVPALHTDVPFSWSEDFGVFAERHPAIFFGFGTGEDRPGLHHHDYVFPDSSVSPTLRLLGHAIDALLRGS